MKDTKQDNVPQQVVPETSTVQVGDGPVIEFVTSQVTVQTETVKETPAAHAWIGPKSDHPINAKPAPREPRNLEDLVKEFQIQQKECVQLDKDLIVAEENFKLQKQQYSLVQDYTKMLGRYITKLMSTTKQVDIDSITKYFEAKLQVIETKLEVLEKQMAGQPTKTQEDSRQKIADQLNFAQKLMGELTKLKQETVIA